MSTPTYNDVRTRGGTLAVTKALKELTWIAALCPPASSWNGVPPVPDLLNPSLELPFLYLRSFAVGYLVADADGEIAGAAPSEEPLKYAFSDDPTDTLFVKVHAPVGSFSGQMLGSLALYSSPTIAGGVPPGKEVLAPSEVTDPGTLTRVMNMSPLPLLNMNGFSHFFIDRY